MTGVVLSVCPRSVSKIVLAITPCGSLLDMGLEELESNEESSILQLQQGQLENCLEVSYRS